MNKLDILKTLFSFIGITYIFYTVFQKYFVDNVFEHLYLLWMNPIYAFLDYLMQNQFLIVALLTLLVGVILVIIIIMFRMMERKVRNDE